jgi:glycerophosphoryl diester phosphodiesterase
MARFTVIAHRGAHVVEGENTAQSFREAIVQHADLIETDVRIAADGILVLAHNAVINNQQIAETTLGELRQLSPDLLTVKEALAEFAEQLPFCWEVKVAGIERDLISLARTLTPPRLWSQTQFTSFIFDSVTTIRALDQAVTVGWLTHFWDDTVIERASKASLTQICPMAAHVLTHPELLDEARRLGLRVRAWGVTSPEQGRDLANLGIYGATIDWPGSLREMLDD